MEEKKKAQAPTSLRSNVAPLLAGIAGGAASTVLLYPLDLIKVRLQVNEDPIQLFTGRKSNTEQQRQQPKLQSEKAEPVTRHYKRRTIMCTLRGVVRHEGFMGLYQGLTPALVGSAASWGGYFFLYEGMKKSMIQQKEITKRRRRREEQEELQRQFRFRQDYYNGNNSQNNNNQAGFNDYYNDKKTEAYDMTKDMHVDEEIDVNTNDDVKLGPMENFAAACAAGAVMVIITNPVWLIKTRMQLQMKKIQSQGEGGGNSLLAGEKVKRPYSGMIDAARTIVREEGPLALYKGAIPAMMLVSHGGVQFVAYEFLKSHFGNFKRAVRDEKKDSERNTVIERLQDSLGYLTMGAISKVIASTTTYPLQVIKSRLQQRNQVVELTDAGEVVIVKREYAGVFDCVTRIWKKEGIQGFFKGCIPNAVRVAPSAAITFVVYESVIDFLC